MMHVCDAYYDILSPKHVFLIGSFGIYVLTRVFGKEFS
jgi:hypothetical protein